jgi:transmembrane sensor
MTRAHDQVTETADQIEEKAAQWVTRIDLRGTPDEWARLDTWLAASPRHRAAFLRLSVAWRRADQLKNLAALSGEVDEDLLDPARWSDAEHDSAIPDARQPAAQPLDAEQLSPPQPAFAHPDLLTSPRQVARSRVAFRFAASVVAFGVIALAGYGAWFSMGRSDARTYSTEVGEFRRVPLGDGSTLALNTNSKVTVRYTANHREVELVRGEALFTVAHNTQRPFDVRASGTVVRAVGTEFSVRLRDELSVDVFVSEGRIAINPPFRSTLAAGSAASVRSGRVTAKTLSADDISNRLSWTTGRLVFQGETLAEVVGEFNRYNSRRLLVSTPDLAKLRIGGTFQATDPDGFATALERTFPVHARRLSQSFGTEVIRLESGVR